MKEVIRIVRRTAAKNYICCTCSGQITRRAPYLELTVVEDGLIGTDRCCDVCAESYKKEGKP